MSVSIAVASTRGPCQGRESESFPPLEPTEVLVAESDVVVVARHLVGSAGLLLAGAVVFLHVILGIMLVITPCKYTRYFG